MRGRPPKRSFTPEQEKAADAFIDAAEMKDDPATDDSDSPSRAGEPDRDRVQEAPERSQTRDLQKPDPYPWQEPRVREDVVKGYPLRMPEPLYLKLKYVSEETGRSMNQLCNEAVETLIESKVDELTSRDR